MARHQELLAEAQRELGRRAQPEFEHGGDPLVGVLYERLADVADYTRRVGLPTASEDYRCDKSLPLVQAAVAVMRQTFVMNAANRDNETHDVIVEATGLVRDLVCAVIPVLGSTTASYSTPGIVDRDQAQRAQGAAEAVRVCAEKLAAHARPDDEEVW